MKAKQLFFPLFLLAALAFFSCDPGPVPSDGGKYERGVFIVCEGPFGSGTGTIAWHDPATGETVLDVFGQENGGAALGNVAQSLTFHNGKGYIVVNNANKIVIVDAATFQFEAEIKGFALPRYLLPMDDQYALLSQWGADGLSGQVLKIDLTTRQVVDSVQVGHGPEKLFRLSDSEVLVPNGGGYGVDSAVQVLDWRTMTVKSVRVMPRANPCAFANPSFAGEKPFVLCKGEFGGEGFVGSWADSTGDKGLISSTFCDDFAASTDGQNLYFSAGGRIMAARSNGLAALFDANAYSLGVDPETGNIWTGDAKDFQSAGMVYVFDANGAKLDSLMVGVIPGEFVFRQ